MMKIAISGKRLYAINACMFNIITAALLFFGCNESNKANHLVVDCNHLKFRLINSDSLIHNRTVINICEFRGYIENRASCDEDTLIHLMPNRDFPMIDLRCIEEELMLLGYKTIRYSSGDRSTETQIGGELKDSRNKLEYSIRIDSAEARIFYNGNFHNSYRHDEYDLFINTLNKEGQYVFKTSASPGTYYEDYINFVNGMKHTLSLYEPDSIVGRDFSYIIFESKCAFCDN